MAEYHVMNLSSQSKLPCGYEVFIFIRTVFEQKLFIGFVEGVGHTWDVKIRCCFAWECNNSEQP